MARPENEPKTPLARRLREIRRLINDMDRADFAETLGISLGALAYYERGDRTPDADVLLRYRLNFNANVDWLLTGQGDVFSDASMAKANAAPAQINKDVFKHVGRLVLQLHKEEGIRLPPDAVLEAQSNAYNDLLARAEDPRDTAELTALLPWLEARLRKALKAAVAEPGTGKRQA
ncbi:helix-turn-helix domain-containing protein [Pannonibacter sp. SL95]|uniref:helix-turn-helix domain-containing protein n=1 Tax=Pannonibacter sp. SL95 TaxID=2995153 RepID=UPI0022752D81|nr:helix-turn-helix transcriptional regulator [Pannonibacter sp. SL95]MCY1706461.1 helix-turn-helix transcriptional regulator [Pannonibacter sp. SL95]